MALLDGDGGGGGDGDGDAGGGNGSGGGGDGDGDGGGDGGEAEGQFQSNYNIGVNENIKRFSFSATLVRLKGVRRALARVGRTCHADEQRELVRRAEDLGMAITVRTYTVLLGGLRLEGRTEEVEQLQAELARRRIRPTNIPMVMAEASSEEPP